MQCVPRSSPKGISTTEHHLGECESKQQEETEQRADIEGDPVTCLASLSGDEKSSMWKRFRQGLEIVKDKKAENEKADIM